MGPTKCACSVCVCVCSICTVCIELDVSYAYVYNVYFFFLFLLFLCCICCLIYIRNMYAENTLNSVRRIKKECTWYIDKSFELRVLAQVLLKSYDSIVWFLAASTDRHYWLLYYSVSGSTERQSNRSLPLPRQNAFSSGLRIQGSKIPPAYYFLYRSNRIYS